MFSSQERKIIFSSIDWDLQRQAYVERAESLNPEFERFKKHGSAVQPAVVDYTLPAAKLDVVSNDSVVRLPDRYRRLRVSSGCAWVTYKASDYVLHSGEEMMFDEDSSDAVVANIGSGTLNFQIIP